MKKFRTGLVVGKFSPLHRGHMLVIDTAIEQCDKVLVLSYSNPEFELCDADTRLEWFTRLYSNSSTTKVVILPPHAVLPNDADDFAHRVFCAEVLVTDIGTTVDAVFTSESYGDGFAQFLTEWFTLNLNYKRRVEHVLVDIERSIVPTSGTNLRAMKPAAMRPFVDPIVGKSFVPRIAILGGESSGKTTLARALAERLNAPYVAEYGREVWESCNGDLELRDMYHIAATQILNETEAAEAVFKYGTGDPYVVCDTTPLTTAWYSSQLFNWVSNELLDAACRQYHTTVLCDPNIPFEQDGTRRDDAFRQAAHDWYVGSLTESGIPYIIVTGSVQERVDQIVQHLENINMLLKPHHEHVPSHVLTDTKYVWKSTTTGRFCFQDETENFNGDYATEVEAAAALKQYVDMFLMSSPKED